MLRKVGGGAHLAGLPAVQLSSPATDDRPQLDGVCLPSEKCNLRMGILILINIKWGDFHNIITLCTLSYLLHCTVELEQYVLSPRPLETRVFSLSLSQLLQSSLLQDSDVQTHISPLLVDHSLFLGSFKNIFSMDPSLLLFHYQNKKILDINNKKEKLLLLLSVHSEDTNS